MRALSTALVGALLVAAASPATAAVALGAPVAAAHKAGPPRVGGVAGDVRCLMSMFAFSQDKTRGQAGQMGVFFFMGRIKAEAPAFDLAAAMKAEAPNMSPAVLQEEIKRCGQMVTGASQSLQAAINGLRPPGAAPAASPAPAAAPAPSPAPAAPAPK